MGGRVEENKKVPDLTGQRFGKLLVLSFSKMAESGKSKVSSWECLCSCGNTTIKTKDYLKTKAKTPRSCGCVENMGRKRLLWGFGINDVNSPTQEEIRREDGTREVIWRCPFYQKWMSMVRRCYSETLHKQTSPSYRDCTVCEEWKYFSNFKVWMEQKNWEGKHLDKDLLSPMSRIYSPETCTFVSLEVNEFMTSSKNARGKYPLGVHYDNEKELFIAQCHSPVTRVQEVLGTFSNPEDAHEAWKDAKLSGAKYLASLEGNLDIGDILIKRYTFEKGEVCQY